VVMGVRVVAALGVKAEAVNNKSTREEEEEM
jgi:hypothetical protein